MEKIVIGMEKTFTKSYLMKYSHEMTVDILTASLPKTEIKVEVSNLNGKYNPDNPTGAAKYLMTRQRITTRYGYKLDGKIEWIPAGIFFMSEWDLPQNGITFSFTARDALEYMSDTYTGPTSGNLYDIAQAALEQAELPVMKSGKPKWLIDSSLANIQAPANADLGDFSINLTFCCQQATVITSFSDLEKIGKDHMMTLNGGMMPVSEYQAVDGKKEALRLIQSGSGTVTPFGVVYDNGMVLEECYNRHQL